MPGTSVCTCNVAAGGIFCGNWFYCNWEANWPGMQVAHVMLFVINVSLPSETLRFNSLDSIIRLFCGHAFAPISTRAMTGDNSIGPTYIFQLCDQMFAAILLYLLCKLCINPYYPFGRNLPRFCMGARIIAALRLPCIYTFFSSIFFYI